MKTLNLKVLAHIEKGENFQKDKDPNANVRIQMYEFFFANTLLKAMKVPFFEDGYMIAYFERVVRKRDTKANK